MHNTLSLRECLGVDAVDRQYYANRFWVGGANTWNSTAGTKWATTSGGASGAAAPTAADDVFFDANSGANTVTLAATSVARSINCTGFPGTISHPAATTLNIGDATAGASNIALKLVAGMTYTLGDSATSAIFFVSTSTTVQTVDAGGKTLGNLRFDGTGGSWQLTSSSTIGSAATVTLNLGTLDTNGQTCSWGFFTSSNTNVRTLTLGASSITITGGGTGWNCGTATNMTINANTSTITLSVNTTFSGGGKTYNNFVCNLGVTMSGANTFNNFTCTGAAGTTPQIQIQSGNQTINGTMTLTGADTGTDQGQILFAPSIPSNTASARTITAAAVSLTNVNFQDIIAAGASIAGGNWTGTKLGDMGGNSNITFDAPRTLYWVANGGNFSTFSHWSTSSGGAGGAYPPLPQDSVNVNASSITSASQTISFNRRVCGKDWNFTGVLNTPTLSVGLQPSMICGSLTLVSGMALAGSGRLSLIGRGAQTITSAGVAFNFSVSPALQISCSGGSYTLQDDLNVSNASPAASLQVSDGTFDANNHNVTLATGFFSPAGTRTLNMGSGTWTLNGTGTVWSISATGMTLNAQTSTIVIADTSVTGKTFAGFSLTYNNLSITGGGTGAVTFSNASTFNNFTINGPKSIIFQSSVTQTITNFTANGSLGNLITITASTAGTKANLTISGTSSCSYCDVKDSNATGAGTPIDDATGGVNSGNNSGWIFRKFSQTLSDSLTHTDTMLRASGRFLSESISHTDILARLTGRIYSETISYIDMLIKSPILIFTETVSHADTLLRALTYVLNETVNHSDTAIRITGRFLLETVSHSDMLLRVPGKLCAEIVSIKDSPGSALQFANTSTTCVNVPNSNSLQITGDITIEAWIKPTSIGVTQYILAKNNNDYAKEYELRVSADGTLALFRGNGTSESAVASTATVSVGSWQHVVATISGTTGKLYLNAGTPASGTLSVTAIASTDTVKIGTKAHADLTNFFGFTGAIDEVRLYARALSASEVAEHYAGKFVDETGLKLYCDFNEGSGSTAHDHSGNGNDGTLINTPTWVGSPVPSYAFQRGISVVLGRAYSEIISHIDTLARTLGRIQTETFALADELVRDVGVVCLELLTTTDDLVRQQSRAILETISHTDTMTVARTLARTVTDSMTIIDSFLYTTIYHRVLTEIGKIKDTLHLTLNGKTWYARARRLFQRSKNSTWYTKHPKQWKQ